jgi:hypothetical protein
MMTQLIKDMPMHEYHSHKSISKSMLGDLDDCPARFKYRHIDGNKREETDSLRLGKAIHTLALEPHLFDSDYTIFEGDRRTNAGKAAYAEAMESGKTVLRQADMEQIEGMANSLVKNPMALALLKSEGYAEATIIWDEDGETFRCRPDYLRNDGLIVDLKTCRSAKPELFTRDAWNYHYDMSVALTTRGYRAHFGKEPDNYVFLCIESEAPYIIECYESYAPMDDFTGMSYLEMGEMRLNRLIEKYKECKAANHWPAYNGKITPMKAPAWAMKGMIENV